MRVLSYQTTNTLLGKLRSFHAEFTKYIKMKEDWFRQQIDSVKSG